MNHFITEIVRISPEKNGNMIGDKKLVQFRQWKLLNFYIFQWIKLECGWWEITIGLGKQVQQRIYVGLGG